MGRPAQLAGLRLVAALALTAGVYLQLGNRSDPRTEVSALTHLNLPDLTGRTLTLGEWHGRVVEVNFWPSWCAPCPDENSAIAEDSTEICHRPAYKSLGIAVDSAAKSREAAEAMGITYPVLAGGVEAMSSLTRELGNKASGLPYTVIRDREGALAASHLGIITEEQLER